MIWDGFDYLKIKNAQNKSLGSKFKMDKSIRGVTNIRTYLWVLHTHDLIYFSSEITGGRSSRCL